MFKVFIEGYVVILIVQQSWIVYGRFNKNDQIAGWLY